MRVTVLMGGPSAEREVSLASGRAVSAALRRAGHLVREVDADVSSVRALRPDEQEVVFIALHGPFGEDGTVQAMLEEAGIPYTGSAPAASRAAMDKVVAKEMMRRAKVFTPEAMVLRREELDGKSEAPGAARDRLGLPVVVKPARQGSSIGVGIVREASALPAALEEAFAYDDVVLVEKYVAGRELTVGILGERTLPVIELRPHREFYDYQAKYVGEQTEYIFEVDLPPATLEAAADMSLRAYRALGCRDLARVDLILDEWQRPFVLEVNTIPGFTDHSLVPKAARRAGITFESLCDFLVRLACGRGSRSGTRPRWPVPTERLEA